MPTLYDEDQQAEPGYVPDDDSLRSITGINKADEKAIDARAHDGTDADKAERRALGLGGGETGGSKGKGSDAAKQVAGNAAAAATTAAGGPMAGRLAKAANFFWGTRRRRTATISGGIGAGSVTGIIVGFIMLMAPLKVVSMVQNLQDHFSAAGEQATQDMTEKLMQHYLVQKVMPGMVEKKCRSSLVSKSCAKVSDSSNVVGQLFEAWRTANLENKMASEYGIEIIRTNNNQFYLKTNSLSERISLGTFNGDWGEFDGKAFAALNRTEFRREYRAAVKGATSWKQMYHRYGMSKLAVNKYGARLCIFACSKTADRARDSIDAKKAAFKSYLNERVVAPRNEMYSLALECAMTSFGCGEGDLVENNGEHTSNFDRDLKARLISVRDRFGQDQLDKIFKDSADIREKGITQHLTEKLIGKAAGQATKKAMPVVGWIDLVAAIVSGERHVGDALTKMNYSMYASTAIQTYMLYRTSADETKAGDTDLTVVGSIADSLNASKDTSQGGLSAEQTPLYQKLNGTSAVSSKVKGNPNSCDEGDTVPDGELVCQRLIVGARGFIEGAKIMSLIATKNPLFVIPGMLADTWTTLSNAIVGPLTDAVIFVIEHTPIIGDAFKYIEDHIVELTAALMKGMVTTIIPMQLGDKPSGGRDYEVAAAGADFLANDYAHTGVGGMRLNQEQQTAIRARYLEEQQQDFQSKPLYARLTDTSDPSSLVSRTALAMPSSLSLGATNTLGGIASNPLRSLFSSVSSIFFGRSSAATGGLTKDPFGITQYGIPKSFIDSMGDPEIFAKKNCQDIVAYNKDWGNKAVKNEETGQYENDEPNLCLALQGAAMASGGKFDSGLIPDYEGTGEEDSTGNSTGGTFTVGSYNILHAEDHVENSMKTGGCNVNPVPDDPICAKTRSARQVQIVTGNGVDNPAFDVFGTQETSPTQYRILKQSLTGYDAFPTNPDHMNNRDQGAVAIWWDKSKFKLVDSGTAKGISNTARNINYPWVELETLGDATHPGGQRFYFMSIHYSQQACSDGNCFNDTPQSVDDDNMRASAELTREWVQSKVTDDTPVFVVGDTNDNLTQKLSYCVLTRGALMQNTWDMANGVAANPDKPCPTNRNNGIDQIYATPNKVSADKWTHIQNTGIYARASDHTPVYTTVTIESDTSGWVWPATKIYPGPCWNSTSTGEYHAGMDMNTRQYGIKAGAARSGTVYRVGSDSAAGNYITVKVANNLYYSYQHLVTGSITVKVGDKVVAGQELGTIGKTGNVILNSSVGHLHMVVSVDGELGGYSSTSQTNSQTRDPLNYLPKPAPNNYTCTR